MPKFDLEALGGRRIKESEDNSHKSFDLQSLGGRKIEPDEPEESYGRLLSQIPRNVLAGAGDILDLPIAGINYGLKKVGLGSENPFYPGQSIAKGVDYLTSGYTKPQTERERTAEATTRAVSGIPSGYAAGVKLANMGNKAISGIGKGLASMNPISPSNVLATGTGAAAMHNYSENNPEDALGTLGSGLGADIAVRTGMGLLNPRTAARAFKVNPKNIEAFREMGVSPTLGQVSDSQPVKTYENILKNTWGSGKLRDMEQKQYERMFDVLGPGARGLAHTELEAGNILKDAMEKYSHKSRNVTGQLKQNFMNKVQKAPTDLIDVTDSLASVEKIKNSLKTQASQEDFLKSPLGKQYVRLEKSASENKGSVPIKDVLEFRTKLFDEISKGELGSVSTSRLSQLRHKLNEDVKDYMEGIGSLREWNRFNKFYANFAEKRKPHLVKSKDISQFEADKIFNSIGHSGQLNRPLLDTLYASEKKSAQKHTMDSIIQKMGKNGDQFDAHKFAKRFESQPKETKDLLLKPLSSETRKKFLSVIDSININKDLAKFGNPSRTAYTQHLIGLGGLGAATAAQVFSGQDISDSAWHSILGGVATIGLSRKIFASPKFINYLYKGSKLKNPKAQQHYLKGLKGMFGRPFYQEVKNYIGTEHD